MKELNKMCSACRVEKNCDDFYNNKKSDDGKVARCKTCCINRITDYKNLIILGLKRCLICDNAKPMVDFNKGDTSDGKGSTCRTCKSERYKAENPVKNQVIENLSGEIWKPIPSLGNEYYASNKGRIKAISTVRKDSLGFEKRYPEKLLTQTANPHGYLYTNVGRKAENKKIFAHRLIAEAFIPNILNKPYINHIDRNRSNNNVENLEWCTSRENQHHRNIGENHECDCIGVKPQRGKFVARIWIQGKSRALGTYEKENDACKAFEVALYNWEQKGELPTHKRANKHSIHKGVQGHQGKFVATFKRNGNNYYVGLFANMDFAKYWLTKAEKDFDENKSFNKYTKGSKSYEQVIVANTPTSIYNYVSWNKQAKKWSVTIKGKYIGIYVSEEEASEAVRVYLNLTETLLRYKYANTKI